MKWQLPLLCFWNCVTFLFALTHSAASLVALTSLALIPQLDFPYPDTFHIAHPGSNFLSSTGRFLWVSEIQMEISDELVFLHLQFTLDLPTSISSFSFSSHSEPKWPTFKNAYCFYL